MDVNKPANMDVNKPANMDVNKAAYMFIGDLLQFCLEKRGIAWQPTPFNNNVEFVAKLFNETIGNGMINMFPIFESTIQKYSQIIWDNICQLPEPVEQEPLGRKIYRAAFDLYCTIQDDTIKNTYIFLAVMVEVSVQCANNGKRGVIQHFVSIIPNVLNSRIPNGFLKNFSSFTTYVRNKGLDLWQVKTFSVHENF